MPSPDFNLRAKPYEHPQDVQTILDAFQNITDAGNRYRKLGEAPTTAAYMRNMSLAVTAARILRVVDDVDHSVYNLYERPPETIAASANIMEQAITNPEFSNLTEMQPTAANTVRAQSALHMAEIYAAWTEYHLTNFGIAEMERAGISVADDLNAFRGMAMDFISEAVRGLKENGGEWEAHDLAILWNDVDAQTAAADPPRELVHPVDKLVRYFSNIQGDPTAESLRFIHILDQRRAAIFAGYGDGQSLDPATMEV
ncbi:MAG: hypothetical protein H6858_09980 [Rhodospirillales bacterium]|nr:hypothetical protein [Alphaproteobacteria bacterium]MCB9977914.1 hypothetical protein [Rhodospirillales bacterium]